MLFIFHIKSSIWRVLPAAHVHPPEPYVRHSAVCGQWLHAGWCPKGSSCSVGKLVTAAGVCSGEQQLMTSTQLR